MKRHWVGISFAAVLGVTTVMGATLGGGRAGGAVLAAPVQAPPQAPGGRGGRGQRGAPAGPPAPVPPEVAIQRPTADELERINASLKRFVDSNTSPDRAVLKKYADLISRHRAAAQLGDRPSSDSVRTTATPRWLRRDRQNRRFRYPVRRRFHYRFVAAGRGPGGGADVQQKYFGDVKIANFAVAGDTTQGVLWGLQNGEGQGHKPKAVMLMIGTNNNSQGNSAVRDCRGRRRRYL